MNTEGEYRLFPNCFRSSDLPTKTLYTCKIMHMCAIFFAHHPVLITLIHV